MCVYAKCEWRTERRQMIVDANDDEPDVQQTFEYPWDKYRLEKRVCKHSHNLLIFFNGIILASWTTGF